MDDLKDWQPLGVEWRLHVIGKNLGRIADAMEKFTGKKENPDRQITLEGYSTKAEWNDYTKTGLSSADSREGDNLTPYKPVDFMHFSTGWSTSELKSAFSEIGKTIKIFDNACEDGECQK